MTDSPMTLRYAVLALLIMPFLSGCFGGGDADEPSDPTTPTGDDQTYRVNIKNHTTTGRVGEPINVTWEVLPMFDADNATNQSITVTHTAIHWGDQSVPNIPTSQGNGSDPSATASASTSGTPVGGTTATFVPSAFEQGGSSPLADYQNETPEQKGVAPALYNESLIPTSNATVYLRAHAIINNVSYWSQEIEIMVNDSTPVPLGTTHIVEIGKTTPGPLSDYAPKASSIKVGDAVTWKNIDALSAQHSATSDAGAPSAFDTGSIAKNAVSAPIYFNMTGSWTYHCAVHPQTMTGATITVT